MTIHGRPGFTISMATRWIRAAGYILPDGCLTTALKRVGYHPSMAGISYQAPRKIILLIQELADYRIRIGEIDSVAG